MCRRVFSRGTFEPSICWYAYQVDTTQILSVLGMKLELFLDVAINLRKWHGPHVLHEYV